MKVMTINLKNSRDVKTKIQEYVFRIEKEEANLKMLEFTLQSYFNYLDEKRFMETFKHYDEQELLIKNLKQEILQWKIRLSIINHY